jgi:hypothetical protein
MYAVSSGRTIAALSAYYTRAEKRLGDRKDHGPFGPGSILGARRRGHRVRPTSEFVKML